MQIQWLNRFDKIRDFLFLDRYYSEIDLILVSKNFEGKSFLKTFGLAFLLEFEMPVISYATALKMKS